MHLMIELRRGEMDDRMTGTITVQGEKGRRTVRLHEAPAGSVVAAMRSVAGLAEEVLGADDQTVLKLLTDADDAYEHELADEQPQQSGPVR